MADNSHGKNGSTGAGCEQGNAGIKVEVGAHLAADKGTNGFRAAASAPERTRHLQAPSSPSTLTDDPGSDAEARQISAAATGKSPG